MNNSKWVIPILLLASVGCSADGSTANTDVDGPAGNLALKLSAQDSAGESYRLRNAEFQISGYSYATGQYIYTNTSVSSETNPDAPVINTRLLEGNYGTTFVDAGWYMEHVTASGVEPVEKAVFLGPSTTYAYVSRGATSAVSFRFGVNGELVDFYGGDLEIGITVEQPPTSSGGSGGTGGTSGGGGFGGFIDGGVGGAF